MQQDVNSKTQEPSSFQSNNMSISAMAGSPMCRPPAESRPTGTGSVPGPAPTPSMAHTRTPPSAPHPVATRSGSQTPPRIIKKEPESPELAAPRHRPSRLDLTNHAVPPGPHTARPSVCKDNTILNVRDAGLACLSPGFITQDPLLQEQLQRSLDVRHQQRNIIEQRLQSSARGSGDNGDRDAPPNSPAGFSRRQRPSHLSIVAPSSDQFASERVIQSAPLGQTFTGMNKPMPLNRTVMNQRQSVSTASHMHHAPAASQQAPRLPPIADVIGKQSDHSPSAHRSSIYANPSPMQQLPAMSAVSGMPPQSARHNREFNKGPDDFNSGSAVPRSELPKPTGYNAPQPASPTPMSSTENGRNSRRRTRAEYEEGSPPLGYGPAETQRQKKEHFLSLCAQVWDLLHS